MARPQLEGSLSRFCHQYLQLEKQLDYPDGHLLRRSDVQEALYESLFAEGAVPFPPPQRYRARVLKELLSRIEKSIHDWEEQGVSDSLMEAFAEVLAVPLPSESEAVQQTDYVTYYLSLLNGDSETREAHQGTPEKTITLLESRGLVASFGTTGLRTWEAALHLGQWLCTVPEIIKGKRILELGAGTGYISVLCAKHLGAARVLASDGSEEVVAGLADASFLNGLQGSDKFAITELFWGRALLGTEEAEWNGGEAIDVVLGSDITYDPRSQPALVGTLGELFDMFPGVRVILSTAERNAETLSSMLDVCKSQGLLVDFIEYPAPAAVEQQGPFYPTGVPIHIVEIRKP